MKLSSWIQAARIPSNANLIFPLLLGWAWAGLSDFHTVSSLWLIPVLIYGWFNQLYIVFLNDACDEESDRMNRTFNQFSGGSRVLPEGLLTQSTLWRAGVFTGLLALLMAVLMGWWLERPFLPAISLIGLMLMVLYSVKPFRLNYRGGGELLQGLGCGLVLPIFSHYVFSGTIWSGEGWQGLAALLISFALHTSSSIATTLPDVTSDRLSGKNTLAALSSIPLAAILAIGLSGMALLVGFFVFPHQLLVSTLSLALPSALLVTAALYLPKNDSQGKRIFWHCVAHILCGILFSMGFIGAFLAS
jgi:1,4-dihydroxy-2-naphthoate polyprenyltransferase